MPDINSDVSIEDVFLDLPNLKGSDFSKESDPDDGYNCIAYAAGDESRWWWPGHGSYWPEGIPRTNKIESYISLFATLGYSLCDGADLEPEIEKVALFALNQEPTHAVRQLYNGRWVSKLGINVDIEHSLDALISNNPGGYGEVVRIFKRPRKEK